MLAAQGHDAGISYFALTNGGKVFTMHMNLHMVGIRGTEPQGRDVRRWSHDLYPERNKNGGIP